MLSTHHVKECTSELFELQFVTTVNENQSLGFWQVFKQKLFIRFLEYAPIWNQIQTRRMVLLLTSKIAYASKVGNEDACVPDEERSLRVDKDQKENHRVEERKISER